MCVCVIAANSSCSASSSAECLNVRLVRALVESAIVWRCFFLPLHSFLGFLWDSRGGGGDCGHWWWRQLNKMQNINYLMNRLIVNRNCILSHKLLANLDGEIPLMEIWQRQISLDANGRRRHEMRIPEDEWSQNEDGHQKWLSLCFQRSNLYIWFEYSIPNLHWIHFPPIRRLSCVGYTAEFWWADVRCVHFSFGYLCKCNFCHIFVAKFILI